MSTTTKKELAKTLADGLGLKGVQADRCVDALFAALREAILQGGRIEVRGFGSWEVRETKPKPMARNPRTGEVVYVPGRKKVRFKVGKDLKRELTKPICFKTPQSGNFEQLGRSVQTAERPKSGA